ncbi:Acetyl-CoA carboxylase [Ectocarpus siliculosus]|uniref:Acetyl-CoA carboxylase, partial n=1 Tax=Ectocarpus siliculosus TaxID=2880 RepID=D7G0I9_ECTSI|nr:Acetyl-CoA carboxylase [Ectocarpus siliculosus]|eukprot:CBJ33018.1 Acetyl-CoA carboxylase [Ectocarpus siliculosus]
MVLKYGALIVDALVEYKQPVFVYIPPHAELRGGAWVVVDSTVNANVMEMYAANGARGGVLEANGAASIKFRNKDLLKTAHRLDPVLMELDAKLSACTEEGGDRRNISAALAERETRVIGVYRQVAVQFADLHDTPGRMEARGAVRKVVPWTESRSFFFWRLRRRLAEFDLRRQAGSIKGHMEQLRFGRVSTQVSELASASPEAVVEGLLSAKGGLSKSARQALLERLSSSS